MGKKVIAKRAPHEKIHKLPGYPRPSTRSQDTTFTPSPSPPTSPPRTTPMARTKTTPRYPAPAKPTPPPKATTSKPSSSKPGSAKPSSSKGKHPAPFPNQHNPNPGRFQCAHKEVTLIALSNLLEKQTLILLLTNHTS
nr:extensin-like [Arachis hypogaea]